MNLPGLRALLLLAAVSLAPLYPAGAAPAKDQDLFNQGKVLMFEQKWDEARQTFQRLIRDYPHSGLLPQACFHSAYCLRLQKKPEEALLAYEQFLQKYPNEPFFVGEARQTIVELAASLVGQGKTTYRNQLIAALRDPKKDVRYFAAIRCSSLKDRQLNPMIVPVLREILAKEKQPDLVNPASIALLSIDPAALAPATPKKETRSQPKQGNSTVKVFRLVIYEGNEKSLPKVDLTVPVSFAQALISALDEPTKAELRKKGIDINNIWDSLNQLGATNILTIRNGGNIVKLWIQ